ncbi:MAG: hypothetical protein RLZZ501_2341 [Pseudomonadota bacterium]|jgi:hypothetical protein
MSAKIIQWQADTSRGLGVSDQIVGAQVGLYPLSGTQAYLVWQVDLSKNVILLDAGAQTLALDFQNGKAVGEGILVLSAYTGTPTPTQRWSFITRKGFITSLANTTLVVDDKGRGIEPGNPVWGYPFNGSVAQQWKAIDPFEFLAR